MSAICIDHILGTCVLAVIVLWAKMFFGLYIHNWATETAALTNEYFSQLRIGRKEDEMR